MDGHWIAFEYDIKGKTLCYCDSNENPKDKNQRIQWFDSLVIDPLLLDIYNHPEPVKHAEDYKEEMED